MKTGAELIRIERLRQITDLNYTAAHDDVHNQREIARAAECYLHHYIARQWTAPKVYQDEPVPDRWPWSDCAWGPKNPLRDLIVIGALIAAEIDRLQRIKK